MQPFLGTALGFGFGLGLRGGNIFPKEWPRAARLPRELGGDPWGCPRMAGMWSCGMTGLDSIRSALLQAL